MKLEEGAVLVDRGLGVCVHSRYESKVAGHKQGWKGFPPATALPIACVIQELLWALGKMYYDLGDLACRCTLLNSKKPKQEFTLVLQWRNAALKQEISSVHCK